MDERAISDSGNHLVLGMLLALLQIAILLFTGEETYNSHKSEHGTILNIFSVMFPEFVLYFYRTKQQAAAPSSAASSEKVPPSPTSLIRA